MERIINVDLLKTKCQAVLDILKGLVDGDKELVLLYLNKVMRIGDQQIINKILGETK